MGYIPGYLHATSDTGFVREYGRRGAGYAGIGCILIDVLKLRTGGKEKTLVVRTGIYYADA